MKYPYSSRPVKGKSVNPMACNPGKYPGFGLKKGQSHPWRVSRPPDADPRLIEAHPRMTRINSGSFVESHPFVPAPPDSHLESFRFIDARDNPLLHTHSRIGIRFRDNSEYEYYFTDHDWAKNVYERMLLSPDPGCLEWSHLIEPQIPYRKIVLRRGDE